MKCRILGLARGMVHGCRPELTGQVVPGWVAGPVGDHQAPSPALHLDDAPRAPLIDKILYGTLHQLIILHFLY